MADPARRRATYEDLLLVPEHLVAEIIHGELITQPRPAVLHARASSRLGAELGGPFDRGKGGPGGWVILDKPEVHLGVDALVPDLGGWRRERMPAVPESPAVQLAPDWVCEVVSPSTQARDRVEKMSIYARECVTYLWLVDPLARTLEAFTLEGSHWLRHGSYRENAVVQVAPFAAIELELGALWER